MTVSLYSGFIFSRCYSERWRAANCLSQGSYTSLEKSCNSSFDFPGLCRFLYAPKSCFSTLMLEKVVKFQNVVLKKQVLRQVERLRIVLASMMGTGSSVSVDF